MWGAKKSLKKHDGYGNECGYGLEQLSWNTGVRTPEDQVARKKEGKKEHELYKRKHCISQIPDGIDNIKHLLWPHE